jgi:hypothetical protein
LARIMRRPSRVQTTVDGGSTVIQAAILAGTETEITIIATLTITTTATVNIITITTRANKSQTVPI